MVDLIPAWPAAPHRIGDDEVDELIRGGFLLCGTPEEICEQLQVCEAIGVDQLCFGVPNNGTYEEALEMIERFGKHVIPEFDKQPDVISTDTYRARARPKYPMFNRHPRTSRRSGPQVTPEQRQR